MTTDVTRVKRPNTRTLLISAVATILAVTATTLGTAGSATSATAKARTTAQVTFTLSSFNVLGSTHTGPGTRRAAMGTGVERIRLAARLLDRTSTDVVGFQELQMDQWQEFVRVAGTRYDTWPGGQSRKMVQNSIAWRKTEWKLVEPTFVKIPYFDGVEWDMPIVKLQNLRSGQEAWFGNFHNPATNKAHPNSTPYRLDAMRREIAYAKSLYRETGLPVFFTGDMNDRDVYFCAMTRGAPMKAANGGYYNFKTRTCVPPKRPMPVDWIFGGHHRGKFTNYVRDDSSLVRRITDHYVIRADVTLPPPPAFVPPPAPTPTPTPSPSPAP